jgi:transposase
VIDQDLYADIRRLFIQGLSQRKIAKRLGLSRTTVSKYCKGAHIPGIKDPQPKSESAAKAEIKEVIRNYYEKHLDDQTKKHKINGQTLWRDLHIQYPRSQATYRRYWAEVRGEWQMQTRMPLSFKIAECAEVDWMTHKVIYRGRELKIEVLCVNLMYGYTPFKKAYPNQKQYNLIDGLISAMEFFGGSPAKFLMDNMTTARKKGYGKDAVLTDEFKLFSAHYGVSIEFTNRYEAAEKGAVEVAAKTAGGILTPVLRVKDFSEVNDRLLAECAYYIKHTGRIGNRPKTVREMTEEERSHLIPLPVVRYEAGVHQSAYVSNQQLFKFDGHTYSAPRLYAGKTIGIIAYPFRVEMYYRGQKIWECDRPFFEDENRVFAEHYLFDLDIKPRSRENAYPLLYGILPPELERFRALCKSRNTLCYQLYELLKMMEEVDQGKLLLAVGIACDEGSPTLTKVQQILSLETRGVVQKNDMDELDKKMLEDDFHVEQRDPLDYDGLWISPETTNKEKG